MAKHKLYEANYYGSELSLQLKLIVVKMVVMVIHSVTHFRNNGSGHRCIHESCFIATPLMHPQSLIDVHTHIVLVIVKPLTVPPYLSDAYLYDLFSFNP